MAEGALRQAFGEGCVVAQAYASRRRRSPEIPGAGFASDQGELFARLAEPGVIGRDNAPDLDIELELRGAINKALREARDRCLGRERVVDRMNLCLPHEARPITKRQLDSWTAQSKEHHPFPLRYLAAFCWAVGSEEPLRVLARALGFDLVDARESAAKRLGEATVEIAALKREVAALTRRLGQ